MIHLQAFGSFDLHDDGESLHAVLSQPKRAALLAYLVFVRPGELHRRDALLAMFWPELDQIRGRNALSQSLTFLRRWLPEGVLVTGAAPFMDWLDRERERQLVADARCAGGRHRPGPGTAAAHRASAGIVRDPVHVQRFRGPPGRPVLAADPRRPCS